MSKGGRVASEEDVLRMVWRVSSRLNILYRVSLELCYRNSTEIVKDSGGFHDISCMSL